MSWGLWNTEAQAWAAINNVVFHARSKSVCVAQIELIKYLNRQHHIEQHAQRQQPAAPERNWLKRLFKKVDFEPEYEKESSFDPAKIPDPPLVPRRFEEWYQKKVVVVGR